MTQENESNGIKRVKRNYPVDVSTLSVSFTGNAFGIEDIVEDDDVYEVIKELPETIRHLLVHGLKQKLCDGHASLKAELNTGDNGKPLPKDEWEDVTDADILGSMSGIFDGLKKGWTVRAPSAKTQTVRMLESAGVVITAGMSPEELAKAMIEAAEKLQSK